VSTWDFSLPAGSTWKKTRYLAPKKPPLRGKREIGGSGNFGEFLGFISVVSVIYNVPI
jgi:hypothetical protein